MPNFALFLPVLFEGAYLSLILIVPAFLLSRFVSDMVGRALLVIFLLAAAGAYFGFAIMGVELLDTPPMWIRIELAQMIAFGAIGLLGLRGSGWWLAAGWGLHPAWDIGLHFLEPRHSFAPK